MINIQIDEKMLNTASTLLKIAPSEVKRASATAINRTITSLRKDASVEARKRYIVKAKQIKDAGMKPQRATVSKLRGVFRVSGGPLPVTAFKMSLRKQGPMRVKVLKSSGAKPVRGLFVRAFPKGYHGPMRRLGQHSYPLKTPGGPSVPQMIGHESVLERLLPKAEEKLTERLKHEIEFRLGRIK